MNESEVPRKAKRRNPTASSQRWAEVRSKIAKHAGETSAEIKADGSEAWSKFSKLGFKSKLWVLWVGFVISFCLLSVIERGLFSLAIWVDALLVAGGFTVFSRWYYVRYLSSERANRHIIVSHLWVAWVLFWVNSWLIMAIAEYGGVFSSSSGEFFLFFVVGFVVLPRLIYLWRGAGRHIMKCQSCGATATSRHWNRRGGCANCGSDLLPEATGTTVGWLDSFTSGSSGRHIVKCQSCGATATGRHWNRRGGCANCGSDLPPEETGTTVGWLDSFTSGSSGRHIVKCQSCGATATGRHWNRRGGCANCGSDLPPEETGTTVGWLDSL